MGILSTNHATGVYGIRRKTVWNQCGALYGIAHSVSVWNHSAGMYIIRNSLRYIISPLGLDIIRQNERVSRILASISSTQSVV
jgi:hypothetical protein